MSFEELPNLIYTFVLVPLGFGLLKTFQNSNRITKLETKQENYINKIDKMCISNDELTKKVHTMIGRLDEHLRNTSKEN